MEETATAVHTVELMGQLPPPFAGVRLFVCLSVTRITREVLGRFWRNFVGLWTGLLLSEESLNFGLGPVFKMGDR